MLTPLLLCASCFPDITVDNTNYHNDGIYQSTNNLRFLQSKVRSIVSRPRLDDTVLFCHFQKRSIILQIMKQVLILQEVDISCLTVGASLVVGGY